MNRTEFQNRLGFAVMQWTREMDAAGVDRETFDGTYTVTVKDGQATVEHAKGEDAPKKEKASKTDADQTSDTSSAKASQPLTSAPGSDVQTPLPAPQPRTDEQIAIDQTFIDKRDYASVSLDGLRAEAQNRKLGISDATTPDELQAMLMTSDSKTKYPASSKK